MKAGETANVASATETVVAPAGRGLRIPNVHQRTDTDAIGNYVGARVIP